jgi:hypothetical protein
MEDVDIRPMGVDQLAEFDESALATRKQRVEVLLLQYSNTCETLRKQLERADQVRTFLEDERNKIDLAEKLARGDMVRVICPECRGSGLRPLDVTSGRIQTASAFEKFQGPPPDKDPRLQCPKCEGQKWLLMDRYRS